MSVVEAVTVTGPLKPLLAFSSLVRSGFRGRRPVCHRLASTRRPPLLLKPAEDQLLVAAEAAGLPLVRIPERRAFDPAVLPRLRAAIEEFSPDIVETHDCKSHLLFLILRMLRPRIGAIRWVAFHHGYTRSSWKILLYQQLDRLTLRHADHVVTVCRPFAEKLLQRGVRSPNLCVVSNFVVPRPRPPAGSRERIRARLGIGLQERIFITIGRLSLEKAQQDLIAAFRKTLERTSGQALRLILVGDGPERARLTDLAAPLGSKVLFTGHVADPWELLHAADVFVLPSHSEGSPLVMFEAMAAGLPIAATAVGGVPETLEDGSTGLLVPPGEPGALADALVRLASDGALRARLGNAAAAALKKFSPDGYASRMLDIYEAVPGC